MMHLLKIEWLKIKKYRTFWILAILFLVTLVLWNYTIWTGIMDFGPGTADAGTT